MGLKLNGATNGSIELDVPDAIGSDLNITIPGAAGTLDRLERAGNILQVVQNYITSASSDAITGGSQANINGFSQSITPTFSSSKILVRVRWNGEFSTTGHHDSVFRLLRNGSQVGSAPADGVRNNGISVISQGWWDADAASTQDSSWFEFLDSPNTTSSITYQVAINMTDSGTLFTNRCVSNVNVDSRELLTSSITLMEVAA